MVRYGVFLSFLVSAFVIFGQETKLDTFLVSTKQTTNRLTTITAKEIAQFQAHDLGEVLQKLPGLTIRNYGGVGGMKTVSVRGLGSSQQQIVRDGFLLPSTQTGQVDLGNVYASNLSSVELIAGGFTDKLLPVSARMGANVIAMERYELQFPNRPYSLKTRLSYGSFGTMDAWLSNKIKIGNRHALALSGSFTKTKGDYSYTFQNYTQKYTGKRTNADVIEGNALLAYRYQLADYLNVTIDYSFFQSDKGLPGAVILYANVAQQRLTTTSHHGNAAINVDLDDLSARFYTSYRNEQITYLDNGYLNHQGFLQSFYHQNYVDAGWVMSQDVFRIFQQQFGIEGSFAKLTGDISEDIQPQRVLMKGYYGLTFASDWFSVQGNIAYQAAKDFNRKEAMGKGKFYLQPSFVMATNRNFPWMGDLQFFYKRSVRLPAFNELYYNQVGNKELLPEIADQFQLSFSKMYAKNRYNHQYGANVYYNQERNKIVAIPTKNLFVWMIQNVGKVQVIGTDAHYRYVHYWDNWNVSTSVNYTYQSVKDVTDKNSTVYRHQVAYFPAHIGNVDVAAHWKNLGVGVNLFAISKRYALNENIPTNEVDGYFTADVQISYALKLKEKYTMTFRAMCKNIGNVTYSYIKYYVMPGVNYLGVIEFEF